MGRVLESPQPGELSKTQRLVEVAAGAARSCDALVEILDLSRVTAEYGRAMYPCKGCVSTAMPRPRTG
jgi:hypothetical protein